MTITKQKFKTIIDKYRDAEEIITRLDREFGINLWDSYNENFYNKYNYCIFELLETIFGEKGRMLIEDYDTKAIDITFDELCVELGIND